jgi:nucleoid DNA-binding protein
MSDIKFDIYESPANDGEKKKYHVRNTNKQTIHSKDLIHEATLYTSVSRSDWAAVVEGLIDILSEKLGDGKRIHINGLGYFSVRYTHIGLRSTTKRDVVGIPHLDGVGIDGCAQNFAVHP